ncbi:MAG: winged helix-turn-helix transcriptional regulator [Methanocorpusculum sp.]|nr:winged helix-turn-helix transcriptional regulator [Methanocorpusculum sp.]
MQKIFNLLFLAITFSIIIYTGVSTADIESSSEEYNNSSIIIYPCIDVITYTCSGIIYLSDFRLNSKFENEQNSAIFDIIRFSVLTACIAVIVSVGFSRTISVSTAADSRPMKILSEIEKNPGCLESGIISQTEFSRGSVSFNLKKLVKGNFVRIGIYHGTKRYYPFEISDRTEQIVCAVVSQEKSRDVFLLLKNNRGLTQSEMAKALNLTQQTIRWHLARFEEDNIICEDLKDGEKIYQLTDEAQNIYSSVLKRESAG